MKDKIKILYVIPRLVRAGTEKHLLNLTKGLNKNRFEVCICCLFDVPRIDDGFKTAEFNIIYLNREHVYDLRIIFDLFSLIRKERYDIVHTYLFGFHYLATIPARITKVPLIISSRREIATWKKFHHHILENLSNLFTDKVIACSEAAREFALKDENLSKDKIVTIYNGIDLNEFYPRSKDSQILNEFGLNEKNGIVGMVTKFEHIKDPMAAVEAISKVKNVYPQIKFLLVGDGPLRKYLEKKTREIKLEENVRFVGLRDNIAQILSIMDIFILTSLSEGLPNVILEAIACGLPVVATNVGGVPEIVENGKSGILVKPQDSWAIANAMINLLEDENLREEMGRYGRETVEKKFSLERMINDYESLYEQLLHSTK